MINTSYGISNYYTNSLWWKGSQSSSANSLSYPIVRSSQLASGVSQTLQNQTTSYLGALNSGAGALKSAAKPFLQHAYTGSFEQKNVTADSTGIAGTATANADKGTYKVNVSQIAQGQVNTGKQLTSASASGFSSGTNTVGIAVGNQAEKSISFTIDATDSNKTGLQKMANAINNAKTGVTASVTSDAKTGNSYLKLTSDKTGTDSSFTITDKYSGNAVALSGTDTVTTVSQDAKYTVGGAQYTSHTNNVSIDNNKVQLTFNKAENKDVTVTVGNDAAKAKSDIKNFVSQYNKMVNLANDYSEDILGAQTLKKDLQSMVNTRRSSLASAGVSITSDGTLSVDDTKIDKALTSDFARVKDTFTGLGEKAYSKSSEVLSSPQKYAKVDYKQYLQQQNSGFYNYLGSTGGLFSSPNNYYSGMLFDSYY